MSAPHLARSYHHLFPLDAFQELPLEEYQGERYEVILVIITLPLIIQLFGFFFLPGNGFHTAREAVKYLEIFDHFQEKVFVVTLAVICLFS